MRYLTWHQFQGSGTNLLLSDVENMTLGRFNDWIDWVQTTRAAEAKAMKGK